MRILKFFTIVLIFMIMLIKAEVTFSQTAKAEITLKSKPEKINYYYRELITDDNGQPNKTDEEMRSINRLFRDSLIIWANNFKLTTAIGLISYGNFLGKRLNIPVGKKVYLTFVEKDNVKEFFYLWCLGKEKYEFEKTKEIKR